MPSNLWIPKEEEGQQRKMQTLESFVGIIEGPIAEPHNLESLTRTTDQLTRRPQKPNFPHVTIATHILSLLPHQTRLALRLVSHTIKSWADTEPSPMRYLHLEFPLSHYSLADLPVLQKLFRQCWHLTVSPVPSSTQLPGTASSYAKSSVMNITRLGSLTHLHIAAPMEDEFYPLLAFRMALQAAEVPELRHVTISPLTLDGLLAMRWGPLSSFVETEWTGAGVWRGLTGLEVGLVPWWRGGNNKSAGISGSQQEMEDPATVKSRTGVMLLHDYLASFAASERIETLKIWWYEKDGPNPLLLDTLPARWKQPLWAGLKPVKWKGLKSLWLGQCKVNQKDLEEIVARCKSLEELWVEDPGLDKNVPGDNVLVDGVWWGNAWLGLGRETNSENDSEGTDVANDTDGMEIIDAEDVYAEVVNFQNYEEISGL